MPVKDTSSATFVTSCRSRDVQSRAAESDVCFRVRTETDRPENRHASGGWPKSNGVPEMGIAGGPMATPAPIDTRFTGHADCGIAGSIDSASLTPAMASCAVRVSLVCMFS